MKMNADTTKHRRRIVWVALLLLIVVALATVAIPVWFIQPFRPQSPTAIALSYALRQWAPLITVFTTIAALLLAVWLWSGAGRWWRKVTLAIVVLPLLPATWFARQNHFEWMFNPLPNPAYAKIADAPFVTESDVVLAVNINGEAVAYPIRFMGYHHLVQDVVGGTPIVATY